MFKNSISPRNAAAKDLKSTRRIRKKRKRGISRKISTKTNTKRKTTTMMELGLSSKNRPPRSPKKSQK
jgi:hypothetical protein